MQPLFARTLTLRLVLGGWGRKFDTIQSAHLSRAFPGKVTRGKSLEPCTRQTRGAGIWNVVELSHPRPSSTILVTCEDFSISCGVDVEHEHL